MGDLQGPLVSALARVARGEDLGREAMGAALRVVVDGSASEALLAAFLTALHVKGETVEEVVGGVDVALERMVPFDRPEGIGPLLDTCGTGGDGSRSINVSTATALIVAACGVAVAKHGNRASTSRSGSADVLEALGVLSDPEPGAASRSLREIGIAFLFAPRHHPGFKHAAPVRRQLPFPTVLNLVGPLANPARPDYQLLGVAGEPQAELIAQALVVLGAKRAAVVTGGDGLDEITLDGPTWVRWVDSGTIDLETWEALDFGLPRVRSSDLRVSGPEESARRIEAILNGADDPARDVLLANASAALLVAGRVSDLREGAELARSALVSGKGSALLGRWRALSAPTLIEREYAI